MCGIWTESIDQLSSTIIVVWMSNMHLASIDDRSHTYLYPRIPRGSRFHPRSVGSATFVGNTLNRWPTIAVPPSTYYVSHSFWWICLFITTVHDLVLIFADAPFGSSMSFVVHFAMGLQRTRSTLLSRQAHRPTGNMVPASLINDIEFVSYRSNGLDLQPGVTHSHSIDDLLSEKHRRTASILVWSNH